MHACSLLTKYMGRVYKKQHGCFGKLCTSEVNHLYCSIGCNLNEPLGKFFDTKVFIKKNKQHYTDKDMSQSP